MTTDRRIRKVFTTRKGGHSQAPYDGFNLALHVGDDDAAVLANRQQLADTIGLPLDRMRFMEQIHSPTVTVVTGDSEDPVEASDAIVTTERDLALVVLTADCVPLLLSDDVTGIIAAVHAGRMGARNGIVSKTIKVMQELGATPAHMHALLGAAASGAHYEVPEDMAADVESRLPGSRTKTAKGTVGLDLRAGLTRQLLAHGVQKIDADPRCTISNQDGTFFSHRREGTTGRQAGVVWMPAVAWE